jgi:hypothetical protein
MAGALDPQVAVTHFLFGIMLGSGDLGYLQVAAPLAPANSVQGSTVDAQCRCVAKNIAMRSPAAVNAG